MTSEDNTTIPDRVCTKCNLVYPATTEFFYSAKRYKDQLSTWCKKCYQAANSSAAEIRTKKRREKKNAERLDQVAPTTKTCTKCGSTLPATSEYFVRRSKDRWGLGSWCKECHANYRSGKPSKHVERTDARREWERNWYANLSPDDRQRIRSRKAKHMREKRQDPIYAESHRTYQRNKLKTPHGKMLDRIRKQRREARRIALPDTLTLLEWKNCLEYFDYACAVCGKREDFWTILAMDHWIPLSSPDCPGTIAKNIVPLCHCKPGMPVGLPPCNMSKRAANPSQWLRNRFGGYRAKLIESRISKYFDSLSINPETEQENNE